MAKKMNMDKGKIILWGIVIAVVILLLLLSLGFGVTRSGAGESNAGSGSATGSYASLPEKCRPPTGQDIGAWKEHLGHHAETQECLQYFKNQ